MCGSEIIQIDLEGLNEEVQRFSFELDDAFFAAMVDRGESQQHRGSVTVDVEGTKGVGCYEFSFHIEGTVMLVCDRCLEEMEQPVTADGKLVVKRGETTDTDGDVLMVDETQRMVDLSWFVYETVELAIPIQHIHPEGTCNPKMLELLASHAGGRGDEHETDPRWKDLEKLRTTIND